MLEVCLAGWCVDSFGVGKYKILSYFITRTINIFICSKTSCYKYHFKINELFSKIIFISFNFLDCPKKLCYLFYLILVFRGFTAF